MARSEAPITEGQLQFHLRIHKRKVRFVAQADGFTLQVEHSDIPHVLFTQRGSPRVFKNLTLAAAFLKDKGVKKFTVILQQRIVDGVAAKGGAESKARGGVKTKAQVGARTKASGATRQRSGSMSWNEV